MNQHTHADGNRVMEETAHKTAARICAAFSHASALGFATLDDQLRYETINDALAAINGFPAAAHLGNSIREIFGDDIAGQIEPRVERLLATGEPLGFELSATLPTRSEPGWFLDHYFAIPSASGKVNRIGLVVVEVTEQRQLDGFINQLACTLRQKKDDWWLARELHDSIEQYHLALEVSIRDLTGKPDKAPELLANAVESLDEHVLSMRRLVHSVASTFPVQSHF